jgi:hypothetical protein
VGRPRAGHILQKQLRLLSANLKRLLSASPVREQIVKCQSEKRLLSASPVREETVKCQSISGRERLSSANLRLLSASLI